MITFVDRHSLFRGAVVFDGEGILDIRKVGLKTMMGKMAQEMQEDEPDSPLKVKLAKLANQISTFGYIGAIVIAVLYMINFIVRAGGVGPYLAQGWPVVLENVINYSVPFYFNYCMCCARGIATNDFFGIDAKYKQDVSSQCLGKKGRGY